MDQSLEARRKRLIYRSCYTGMKETDLLLGAFARAHVPTFTPQQLDRYEAILDLNADPQLYAWATGQDPVPAEHDHDVMHLLRHFKINT